MTTSVSGRLATSTQFGVKVADSASTGAGSAGAAQPMKTGSVGAAVGAAVIGLAAVGF